MPVENIMFPIILMVGISVICIGIAINFFNGNNNNLFCLSCSSDTYQINDGYKNLSIEFCKT